MKELNKILTTGNTTVTQADKGKNIVIINSKEYSKKVHSFLIANNFNTSTKDPTDKFQKLINKTMQDCNLITDKRQIKFLTQKKPSPPTLKAQLKSHKTDIPIHPVINNKTALAYKLAKHLAKIVNQYITSNNHYNVTNSTNLANDLTKLEIHENHRMITFDIKDLYINPLKPELNPICYLLALLAHHFLHVSRIMVKSLTLRLLMSYIYGAHILDVSRSHTTTHHSR